MSASRSVSFLFTTQLDKNVNRLSLAVTNGRNMIYPYGLNKRRHKPSICSARVLNVPHNIHLSHVSFPDPLDTSQ